MTDRFDECYRFVVGAEGGDNVKNLDHDKGGRTVGGITQWTYDRYRQFKKLPQQPVTMSTADERKEAYLLFYWHQFHCEDMPRPMDLVLFDSAVQHSPVAVGQMLREALGIDPGGGAIGPITLAAAARCEPYTTALKMIDLRRAYYKDLAKDPKYGAPNFSGWMNRLAGVQQIVLNEQKAAEVA